MANEPQIMKVGIDAGLEKLAEATYEEERLREDWVRFHIRVSPREASNLVQAAGRASEEAIRHTGLRAVRALPRKA